MRILAVDPGEKKIGLAISDPVGIAARPLATLERGYALVQSHDSGEVISNISQVERGDMIKVQVSDGQFNSRVTGAKKGLAGMDKGLSIPHGNIPDTV
jgi:hypothetical protein